MIHFEHQSADFGDLVNLLAKRLHTKVQNGRLVFPKAFADGYVQYIKLPNGLQVNIIQCKTNVPWFFTRLRHEEEEYYTLRFDDITIPGKMAIGIQGEVEEKCTQRFSVAYLTSSLFDWHYQADAGTRLRAINVLIPKEWLGRFLGIDLYQQILPAYIALRSRSLAMEPLDPYYKELMDELINNHSQAVFPTLFVMNRVQMLMERFFNHIHTRVSMVDVQSHYKNDDVRAVMAMEKEMLSDFSAKPLAIDLLSRKAAMSATKFKNLFKSVFGIPVYEYYQLKRMQKASELLASGKYSVRETGMLVGYQNISNFSAAFKKHFKKPPHDFMPRK